MQVIPLFEPEINIPHSDFRLFKSCNDAPRGWHHKQQFYQLKKELLDKFAINVNTYDVQIVHHKCHTCGGTGLFRGVVRCNSCRKGIYATRIYHLKRYVLNGQLFHVPSEELPKGRIINTFTGLVEHPQPEVDYRFAYFCLIKKYRTDQLPDYLRQFRSSFTRADKKRWGEVAANSKDLVGAMVLWYSLASNDDLPF